MSADIVTSTIKVPAELYELIRERAAAEHRSINAEMLVAMEAYFATTTRAGRLAAIGDEIAQRHADLLQRLA